MSGRGSKAALGAALLVGTMAASSFGEGSSLRGDISVRLEGGARATSRRVVTLSLGVDESEFSPAEMATSSDGDRWSPWSPFVPTSEFVLPDGDGEKTVFARLRDAAGRERGPFRASIILDTVPPEGNATAPAQVRPGEVAVVSDVPDAVAMQLVEGPAADAPWEPYARPKEFSPSPGLGVKTIAVRYRDEAGNISAPVILTVDVREDAPERGPESGIRSVRVSPAAGGEPSLRIVLTTEADGILEMEVRVDGTPPLPREKFSVRRVLDLERTGGAHRIELRLWDESGAEHFAAVAFLEQDLAGQVPEVLEDKPTSSGWFADLRAGFLIDTLGFEALTSIGPRDLESGTVALARAEIGLIFLEPLYVKASFEVGQGDDVEIFTGGLDFGFRFLPGSIWGLEAELNAEIGGLYSTLEVTESGFGDFEPGFGYRVALGLGLGLSDSLSARLALEYRDIAYEWSDTVVSGDEEARARGAAVTAGMTLRF